MPIQQILGQDDRKFFTEETAAQLRQADKLVIDTQQVQVEQLDVILKSTGATRTCITTKSPLYDEQKQLIGLCGVTTDITEQREVAERLEESLLLLDTVLNNVSADIYMKDEQRRYIYVNQRVLNASGMTQQQMLGRTDAQLFPRDRAERYQQVDDEVFSSGKTIQAEEIMVDGVGNKRHYWSTKLLVQAHGKPSFLIGFSTDITALKQAELALARSESRFRALFESSSEAMVLMADSRFLDCNKAALSLVGVKSKAEFLKLTPADLSPPKQSCGSLSATHADKLIAQAFEKGHLEAEWAIKRYDNGAEIPIEVVATAIPLDEGPALLMTLRDLTERKRHEEQINQLAFYDMLTRLPNRRLLYDRLAQSLVHHHRINKHGAIVYLDLDNFKPLNDRHGHAAGDLLLQEVANRLVSSLRAQDTVSRLGGDEFAALLVELDPSWETAIKQAALVAEKLRGELARPYRLTIDDGHGNQKHIEHHCTASFGVCVFHPTEKNADDVVRRADDAMYQAKSSGRNRVCLVEEEKPTTSHQNSAPNQVKTGAMSR